MLIGFPQLCGSLPNYPTAPLAPPLGELPSLRGCGGVLAAEVRGIIYQEPCAISGVTLPPARKLATSLREGGKGCSVIR